MEMVSNELAHDIIFYVCGARQGKAPSKHAGTLRRTVSDMLDRHCVVYNGMMAKLDVSENSAKTVFTNVVDEIFRDGQFNWGRLVSVFAFGSRIGMKLYSYSKNSVEEFANFLGKFVAEKFGRWIQSHGGWVRFQHFSLFLIYFAIYASNLEGAALKPWVSPFSTLSLNNNPLPD